MDGYGWVILGGALVFFGGMFVYLMFMIFLPEWVGITGPKALAAEASHRAPEAVAPSDNQAAVTPHDPVDDPVQESVASELTPEADLIQSKASDLESRGRNSSN